jgi:cytochrome c-type biogenesis protein CcmH
VHKQRKFWQAGLACLLVVLMLGARATAGPTGDPARFSRIGHNMMCTCSCGQILLECNHVGCPDSSRMIGELRQQLTDSNAADAQVENWFVAKYGATVLAAPMRGGFDNVAWIVPIAIFILATLGTGILVRTWSQRRKLREALAGPMVPTTACANDTLRDRIRRETEY